MAGDARREIGKDRLLTGRGRYVADLAPKDAWQMVVIRSPHAHARVEGIDLTDLPQEGLAYRALTAEDLRRLAPRALEGDLPALAVERVRYVGQPVVALAVAGDRYRAEDLAERVRVTYAPLPAVTDPDRPADGPVRARPDRERDDAFADEAGYGDVDGAFARADVVVEFSQRIGRASAHPLETQSILCLPDPLGGLTVYAAHQGPHSLRAGLAAATGLEEERLRVITPDVGGGFGVKNGVYPEFVACAVLALLLRRPVVYLEDRLEHFTATTHERDQIQRIRLAATRDGTLLGLEAEVIADHGAYALRFPVVGSIARRAAVIYRLPSCRVRARSVYTHKTPQGPYRGAGRPQANFLMERAMDRLADRLGMDRVELRRKNLRRPDEYPVELPMRTLRGPAPVEVDVADLVGLLELTVRRADLPGLRAEQARRRARGEAYGIGLSVSLQDTGTPPFEGARVDLAADGTLRVVAGTPTQGQGHETLFAHLAAQALGVSPTQVRVEHTDTARLPRGIGTFGSRTASTGAVAVHQASLGLREKILKAAAQALEAAPEDIEWAGDVLRVVGSPQRNIRLVDLARRFAPREGGGSVLPGEGEDLSQTSYVPLRHPTYGAAVHLCTVSVDLRDFRPRLERYLIGYDVGRRLQPALVEGQLMGGLSHGLSGSLFEELIYGPDGQLLTQTYLDYLLPTATDMPPRIELVHRETPTPLTPLGARGVGESGTIASPAAIASAVEDALAPWGIRIEQLPITPNRLYEAFQRAGVKPADG